MHNATFPTKTGRTDWASAVTGQGNLTGHQLLQVNVLRYTKKVRKRKPKYRGNELQNLGHCIILYSILTQSDDLQDILSASSIKSFVFQEVVP